MIKWIFKALNIYNVYTSLKILYCFQENIIKRQKNICESFDVYFYCLINCINNTYKKFDNAIENQDKEIIFLSFYERQKIRMCVVLQFKYFKYILIF